MGWGDVRVEEMRGEENDSETDGVEREYQNRRCCGHDDGNNDGWVED